MAWTWPTGRFDIVTKPSEYVNCAYIGHNDQVVTVERDYRAPFGRVVRLRTQILIETIETIHGHAVTAEAEAPTPAMPEAAAVAT